MFSSFSLTSNPTSMRIFSLALKKLFNHKHLLPACLNLNKPISEMYTNQSQWRPELSQKCFIQVNFATKKFNEKQIIALGMLPTFCLIVYK